MCGSFQLCKTCSVIHSTWPHVRWPEPCDFVLAVLWFSHALTTDCIRLQLRIFRKHPPSNPHCHLCNLHHCDHVHQYCGTSFAPFYMVWQNTVGIKDLKKASLSCLVFQNVKNLFWALFNILQPSLYVEMANDDRTNQSRFCGHSIHPLVENTVRRGDLL